MFILEKERETPGNKKPENKEAAMNKLIAVMSALATSFAALMLLSMSLSPNWSVQRRVYINAKPAEIMPYVNNAKSWVKWNEWAKARGVRETKMVSTNGNTAAYVLKSDGKVKTEKSLVTVVRAEYGSYVFLRVEGRTDASPLTRYLIVLHNDVLGKQLTGSLLDLKKDVEKNQ
jgi:hypothetical protein